MDPPTPYIPTRREKVSHVNILLFMFLRHMNSKGILCFQTYPTHLTLISRFRWKVRSFQMGFGVVEMTTYFSTNQTRKCLVLIFSNVLDNKVLKTPVCINTWQREFLVHQSPWHLIVFFRNVNSKCILGVKFKTIPQIWHQNTVDEGKCEALRCVCRTKLQKIKHK